MNTYGNVFTCQFGRYNTCAWESRAIVRTYGDFLLLASKVLKLANLSAFAAAPEKVLDGSGRAYFPPPSTGTTVASLFARLKKLVVASPTAVALVTEKAAEYYTNVELATGKDYKAPVTGTQKRGPGVPAAPAAPAFQPSYAPASVAPAPAVEAPSETPFYQREWFAPVAVVAVLGVAALFLLPKRA